MTLIFSQLTFLFWIICSFQGATSKTNGNGCSMPQTPFNGNYEVEGCEGILADPFNPICWKSPLAVYPAGQIVKYFCNSGYYLRGAEKIECLEAGSWNTTFPKCCKPKNQASLDSLNGVPLSGVRSGEKKRSASLDIFEKAEEKRFEIGDETLSCPPLIRTNTRVEFECLTPDGRINNCEVPPLPPYTVAHLKCARYYKSSGDLAYRYRKCKPDGTWSTEGSITCIADCGKSDVPKKPLILNGKTSERGEWPWHAAIFKRLEGKWENVCGGSLISHQAILTAAHCVSNDNGEKVERLTMRVALGQFNRGYQKDANIQVKNVKEIIIHPSYSALNFDSDIAIIILETPVKFDFFVRPVCFPEQFNSLIEEYQIQEGNLGTVVGWGLNATGEPSEKLQMVDLPVISSRKCIDSFREFFKNQARYTNFCAGYRNSTGVCNGDSGGGMVFPSGSGDNLKWYLQGIVSVGAPGKDGKICSFDQYALFTRVGRYTDWLVRNLSPDGYI